MIGSPIWLGQMSAVAKLLIERLYAMSAMLNEQGQWIYYGKTGGCVITGNEDGVKHCAMEILYSLQHLGYVVPPQADCGWIGAIGPGPSYLDEGSGGPENEFTQRNTTFMTWNLMHMARLLRDAGGYPVHGNQREALGRRLPLRLSQSGLSVGPGATARQSSPGDGCSSACRALPNGGAGPRGRQDRQTTPGLRSCGTRPPNSMWPRRHTGCC